MEYLLIYEFYFLLAIVIISRLFSDWFMNYFFVSFHSIFHFIVSMDIFAEVCVMCRMCFFSCSIHMIGASFKGKTAKKKMVEEEDT